jgi:segregation and condensation protein B
MTDDLTPETPAEPAALPPADEAPSTDVREYLRAIEAVVLVAHDPVPPVVLAQLLERPTHDIEEWCDLLAAEYLRDDRGFELVKVAGGYRFQTHADLVAYVERFLLHDQRARLSSAALETLAIIAYKQPISRGQIASIRGVDPDGVIRTLQSRGYIDAVGRDPGPGQAVLYGTTAEFLEKLGINSTDDLPPIAEFIPSADVVEALEAGLK